MICSRAARCCRLVALGVVFLPGCGGNETAPASTQTVDSAGVRITTITSEPSAVPIWTVAPRSSVTLTNAATGDSSAFAVVGAVRWLTDGRIVVADVAANRLLVFDSSGAYQRALGRPGDGPGELRYLSSVSVLPGDSLATFDARLRRLSLWHPERGFVRSLPVGGGSLESWPADAWFWQDSLVVVLQLSVTPLAAIAPGAGVRRWPMRARLTLHDSAGTLMRSSPDFEAMYSGLHANGDTRLPFSNQSFTAVARERVYFGSGTRFSLSYVDGDFTWEGDLRWPAQQEALTSEEVAQVRAELVARVGNRISRERLRQTFATSFAEEILPKERPAIGRVLVSADGNIWVERFEATRLGSLLQKPSDRWTIVQPDGTPVARLRLPAGSRLEDVRGTRIVLVMRDSLDVQTVAVRELVKP